MITTYKKPVYNVVEGFMIPNDFPAENFISAKKYQPSPDDTFICTYPKCGTTWVQHICWLIMHDGNPITTDTKISLELPFLELLGGEYIATKPAPRFIKTHLPHALTPWNPESKYIYVARNPFDCLVSFFHHTKGFPQYYQFEDGTFNDFFECFIRGEVDFGDFFDHVLPWYALRHESNVFFVTYEEFKFSFDEKLKELITFLGERYAHLLKHPDILEKIKTHSSFDKMKEEQSRWISGKRPDDMPFIRKGIVGDWKNVFSDEQYQRLKERLYEKSEGNGLVSLWEKYI